MRFFQQQYKKKKNLNRRVVLDWKQGTLGDCWLIAAFNIFVTNEVYKHKVIKLNNNGDVDVHIYFNGIKMVKTVEPVFPLNLKNELKYASSDNSKYASLIEKAIAQANTTQLSKNTESNVSYTSLIGGFMTEG